MNLNIILAIIVVAVVIYLAFPQRKPGEPPLLPLLSVLEFSKDPNKFLRAATAKYGDVFSIWAFGKKLTFVTSPQHIRQISRDDENLNFMEGVKEATIVVFAENPKEYDLAFGNIPQYHLYMDVMRKILLPKEQLQKLFEMFGNEVDILAKKWRSMGQFDLLDECSMMVLTCASKALLGSEFLEENPSFIKMVQTTEFNSSTKTNLMLPWLPFGSPAITRKYKKITRDLLEKYIQKRIDENRLEGEDFLSANLREFKEKGEIRSARTFAGTMLSAIMAAHINTASSAFWGLAYSYYHKEKLLSKFREQLDSFPDTSKYEAYSDLKSLDYLLKEINRIVTMTVTGPRKVVNPNGVQVGGYTIPKGADVTPFPGYLIKHIPDWDNCDPWRWENSGEWGTAFYPFGFGPHACLGRMFATLLIKTLWSRIFLQYDLKLLNGNFPEMDNSKLGGQRLPLGAVPVQIFDRK